MGFFSLLCSSWLWIWSVGVNKVSENIIHFEWMNEWKVKRKLKKVKKIIFCDYDDDHHPTTTTTKTWENFFPIHIFRIQKKKKIQLYFGAIVLFKVLWYGTVAIFNLGTSSLLLLGEKRDKEEKLKTWIKIHTVCILPAFSIVICLFVCLFFCQLSIKLSQLLFHHHQVCCIPNMYLLLKIRNVCVFICVLNKTNWICKTIFAIKSHHHHREKKIHIRQQQQQKG